MESLAANKLKQLICVQWSEKESLELFSHFPFQTEMSSHQPHFSFSHILSHFINRVNLLGRLQWQWLRTVYLRWTKNLFCIIWRTISFQMLLCYPEKKLFLSRLFSLTSRGIHAGSLKWVVTRYKALTVCRSELFEGKRGSEVQAMNMSSMCVLCCDVECQYEVSLLICKAKATCTISFLSTRERSRTKPGLVCLIAAHLGVAITTPDIFSLAFTISSQLL